MKNKEKISTLYSKMRSVVNNCNITAFALFILICSCDGFVEVDLPASQLTSETVFKDVSSAEAALAGMYAKLRSTGMLNGSGSGISFYLGLYADELDYYQQTTVNNFYNNSLFAADFQVTALWNQSYNQIYTANSIIEGLNKSTSIPSANKNQLIAEALFIRGLLHFTLTNLFGDIPYIKSIDYKINSTASKLTTAEIYENSTKDLSLASDLISETYPTSERTRPNRSTVKALMARVYLFMKLYPEASNAASSVINNPLYKQENNLDRIFLKACSTTIWQFSPSAAGANTSEGNLFILKAGPPQLVALRPDFINAFEPGDKRKTQWTAKVTNGSSSWYYVSKYKQDLSTPVSVEYSVVLRLAEQHLIRAEARAYQGDLIGAKEDLNIIRNNAGVANTTAQNAEEIIEDVLKQRRFEFFTEFGHRFFDLKRNGKLDQTLSLVKAGWNSDDELLPIPDLELNANPNLKPQNPGY